MINTFTFKAKFALIIITTVFAGCAQLTPNRYASTYERQTSLVMTEYSNALQCVGELIDASPLPGMMVYVRDIDDETVPSRYRDRRLSKGGAWWFHTAISKMQSRKVRSVIYRPTLEQRNSRQFMELTGAWTQDDAEIGKNSKNIGFNNLGNGILDRLGWSKSESISVIAGDFVSSVGGKVQFASAIALAISESGDDLELRIDDGSRRFDLALSNEVSEGPQFAQRRIAEAAALVHIAKAFELDYQSCMITSGNNPDEYRTVLNNYITASPQDQIKQFQSALKQQGYSPGKIDGVWGEQSKQALILFQQDNQLMPNGLPSERVLIKLNMLTSD